MKEQPLSIIEVNDIFTKYLQQKHYRKTPERYAILERIYSYKGHFNAEIIHQDMQKDYRVSLATVYNTLSLLVDANLIVKLHHSGGILQYEKKFFDYTQHQLVCTNCGKVKDFSDKQIRIAIRAKSFAYFNISHYSLYLFGLCSKCSTTENSE